MKQLAQGCVPLLLMFGWCVPTVSADTPQQQRIHELIASLGSDSYAERDQAAKELDAAGAAALDALRAAVKHPDAEIGGRAAQLQAVIEERLIAAQMLAAKKVRLVVNDESVFDAVSRLSRDSKCQLEIVPEDREPLKQRKITLDTGEVTFWQALDRLCQSAGLRETTIQNVPNTRTVGNKVYYLPNQPQVRSGIWLTVGTASRARCVTRERCGSRPCPAKRLSERWRSCSTSARTRLKDFAVVGSPHLSNIVDDQQQLLTMMPSVEPDHFPAANMVFGGGNVNGNVNVIINVNGKLVQSTNNGSAPSRGVPVRIKLGTGGRRL